MNKITFLFGAGASKNALPLVKEIPIRLNNLIEQFNSESLILDNNSTFQKFDPNSTSSKREFQIELVNDLLWLYTESARHSSVDTFAKKLTIKRDYENLERLKTALTVFLICEQALNKFDNRYDSFFASIINNDSSFPENIRVLSWNYDYQFEMAYSEYSGESKLLENQRRLNIKQKIGYNIGFNGFSITKLNGTTELHVPSAFRQFAYVEKINSTLDKGFVEEIVRRYAINVLSGEIKSTLSFAWEAEMNIDRNFIDNTINDVKDAIVLVVIGYSFPFFNREVDRKIIGSMNQLKRVYFQAPDADALVERFKAIKDDVKNIDLVPRFDTEQFLLPNEL